MFDGLVFTEISIIVLIINHLIINRKRNAISVVNQLKNSTIEQINETTLSEVQRLNRCQVSNIYIRSPLGPSSRSMAVRWLSDEWRTLRRTRCRKRCIELWNSCCVITFSANGRPLGWRMPWDVLGCPRVPLGSLPSTWSPDQWIAVRALSTISVCNVWSQN